MKYSFGKNGSLDTLSISSDESIISQWGVEFGDSQGYFSLAEKDWGAKVHEQNVIKKKNYVISDMEVALSEGWFNLHMEDTVSENKISRIARLTAQDDVLLMDFVLRYVFLKKYVRCVQIDGDVITHKEENKYHQYPVSSLKVFLKSGEILTISAVAQKVGNFSLYVYARDHKDTWIIHVRLLPKEVEKEIIKLNVPWYNRSIPDVFSKRLLRIDWVRNAIWYVSEKDKFPWWNILGRALKPNGYGLARVNKNEVLELHSTVSWEPDVK